MKKATQFKQALRVLGFTAILALVTITACKKDPVGGGGTSDPNTTGSIPAPPIKINPSNANGVTTHLQIVGSTRTVGGLPPYQKPFGDSIALGGIQKSIEVTAGGEILLPVNYTVMTAGGTYSVREYYIHVVGADSTIKVTNSNTNLPANGTMIHRIKVPSYFSYGQFCFNTKVTFVRSDGSIYQTPDYNVCVGITAPKTCGQTVSGSEGLTFTTLRLSDAAGTATVNYDTYTVPDRIDIYYNQTWVGGTGANPGPIPPQKNCSYVTTGDGFLGATGKLTFSYNPNISKEVTVVVSGCLGSSTAWDYSIVCP
jgi:hypothetical protein